MMHYIYHALYRWASIKSTCKLSVRVSKNLRWLNKQVKRVPRSDTRPVSRLYDFVYISIYVCICMYIYMYIYVCICSFKFLSRKLHLETVEKKLFLISSWNNFSCDVSLSSSNVEDNTVAYADDDDDDDALFFWNELPTKVCSALFPSRAIIRSSHHLIIPTCREQCLRLRTNSGQTADWSADNQ